MKNHSIEEWALMEDLTKMNINQIPSNNGAPFKALQQIRELHMSFLIRVVPIGEIVLINTKESY